MSKGEIDIENGNSKNLENGSSGLNMLSMSKGKSYDSESDTEEEVVEKTTCDKFINLIFCRGDLNEQKLTAQPVSLAGLFRFATKFDILLFLIGTTGAIISGFAQPILALLSGNVFNLLVTSEVDSTEFRDKAFTYVYMFIGLGICIAIINFTQFMCFQHVCCRLIAQLRHQYMKSIMRQNAGWFDRNHSGTLVTQLNDNVERIREGIGDKLGLLVRGFAMFIGGLVVAFFFEWRLALYMCILAPLACACMSLMARKLATETSKELHDVGKAGAIAEESILGVRTVQAFNGQDEMVNRYETELRGSRKHAIRKSVWSGLFGGFFYTILLSFMGTGMLFGGYLVRVGIVDEPGKIFVVVMSMMIGAYFLGQIAPHLMVLLNARVAAAVIYKTIDRKPKIDVYSDRGSSPAEVIGKVEFMNVHFRYPTRQDVKVLNGLNLVIEPGQTVALVGHSGCGKSTSVGLLTRLYEVESGKVLLDGNDVRNLNIEWLRNMIGIVQQEPILFNDTVEENLKIGSLNVTRTEMIEACKMANAHDFVMKLPKGYQTLIGDGGVQLSGGQKQRIAIARTLVRNPRILLLDEATSALDAQSESIVQSALDNAAAGRSTIVIAHRLSTIRNADKIAVFDKGVIVEQGTHEELVSLGGIYSDLVKAQQFTQDVNNSDDTFTDDEADRLPTQPRSRQPSVISVDLPGRDAFVRGSQANDSIMRSSTHFAAGDQFLPTQETEAFQRRVQDEMDNDTRISAGLTQIFRNAQGNYVKMFFAFVFAIIRGFEIPGVGIAFGLVFKAFEYYKTDPWMMQHKLVIVCIVYTAIGIGTLIFQFSSCLLFGIMSENITLRFRLLTFRNILHQDAAYFDNPAHAPGKLITRLATDAPNVKAVVDGRMQNVVANVTSWVICIGTALVTSWPVGIVGTLLSLILAFLQVFLARIIQKKNISLMRKNNAGRYSIEIIENVRTIQLLTRENYFLEKYVGASKSQKRNEMYKGWFEGINFAVSQTFIYFALGCGYAIGIHVIYIKYELPNEVYGAVVSVLLSCIAVMQCSSFFPEFVKARTAAGMLFNMIQRQSKTGDSREGEKPKLRGNLLFDDVRFVYPQRPHQPVMQGLQFTANRGQTVALVGPSGSGKSTVISLLERFYDVLDGFVRFDGTDIRKLSLHHIREQMALVGQEPRLFAGTIRSNICFGMEVNPDDEQIHHALQLANAHSFVGKLPQGLETEVGERGTQLSGGQKQRIAIARALIRDPVILLLDEATSALDSESEKAVQEALDSAREGRTCITIAHRLSSIQNADIIVYVENGKVRESGNHNTLMTRKGRYYQLIKKQDLTS